MRPVEDVVGDFVVQGHGIEKVGSKVHVRRQRVLGAVSSRGPVLYGCCSGGAIQMRRMAAAFVASGPFESHLERRCPRRRMWVNSGGMGRRVYKE